VDKLWVIARQVSPDAVPGKLVKFCAVCMFFFWLMGVWVSSCAITVFASIVGEVLKHLLCLNCMSKIRHWVTMYTRPVDLTGDFSLCWSV
jgi:hypothetical protein